MDFKQQLDNKRSIYITLDTIFDTRITTLLQYDKELGKRILTSEYYNHRLIDSFEYLTFELFQLLYMLRDTNVLQLSYFTNIFDIVVREITTIKNNGPLHRDREFIELVIDTYPYRLTDYRIKKLKDILYELIPIDRLDITIEYKVDISLDIVRDRYYSLIVYDGLTTLDKIFNRYDKGLIPIPDVRLYMPALLREPIKLDKPEEYEKLFKDMERSYSPLIDIVITPVKYYNIK